MENTSSVNTNDPILIIDDKEDDEKDIPRPDLVCKIPLKVIGIQQMSPVAWSDDSSRVGFVSGNYSIYICEVTKEKINLDITLFGPTSPVLNLYFHPTATVILAVGDYGIMIWNYINSTLLSHKKLGEDSNHESCVTCGCFILDGKIFVSGSKDNDIILWAFDVKNGLSYLETIHGHKAPLNCLMWNQQRSLIASAGRDSSIKIWDCNLMVEGIKNGQHLKDINPKLALLKTLDGHRGDVIALQFFKDGLRLLSGARDNQIKMWDLAKFGEIRTIGLQHTLAHKGDIRALFLLDRENFLLSVSADGHMKYWKIGQESKEESVLTLDQFSGDDFQNFLFEEESSDWKTTDSKDEDDQCVYSKQIFRGIADLALCGNRPILVVSGFEASVQFYKWNHPEFNPSLILEYCGHDQSVTDLCVVENKDNHFLISGSNDPQFYLFDINTVKRLNRFSFDFPVTSITVDNNHKIIFVAGNDYRIKAYPLESGLQKNVIQSIGFLEGHTGRVENIALNHTNKVMVSASHDFSLCLWDVSIFTQSELKNDMISIEPISRLEPHDGHIFSMAFSQALGATTSHLVTCAADHTFKLWKVKDFSITEIHRQTEAHSSVIVTCCWGKEATKNLLITGGWDEKVKVWKVSVTGTIFEETNCNLAQTLKHTSRITDVLVDDSGIELYTSCIDGRIYMWKYEAGIFNCFCYYFMPSITHMTCLDIGESVIVSGSENGMIAVWPRYRIPQYTNNFVNN